MRVYLILIIFALSYFSGLANEVTPHEWVKNFVQSGGGKEEFLEQLETVQESGLSLRKVIDGAYTLSLSTKPLEEKKKYLEVFAYGIFIDTPTRGDSGIVWSRLRTFDSYELSGDPNEIIREFIAKDGIMKWHTWEKVHVLAASGIRDFDDQIRDLQELRTESSESYDDPWYSSLSWEANLYFARNGEQEAIDYMIRSVQETDDWQIYDKYTPFLINDLIFMRQNEAIDLLTELLNSDVVLDKEFLRPIEPYNYAKMILKKLYPIIENFPKDIGTHYYIAAGFRPRNPEDLSKYLAEDKRVFTPEDIFRAREWFEENKDNLIIKDQRKPQVLDAVIAEGTNTASESVNIEKPAPIPQVEVLPTSIPTPTVGTTKIEEPKQDNTLFYVVIAVVLISGIGFIATRQKK